MAVEELTAIIGMEPTNGEGHAGQDTAKPILHHPITTPQKRNTFTPAAEDINHLQRMHVLTVTGRTAMMHEIHFEVTGFCDVPRQATHGNVLQEGIRAPRCPPGFLWFVLTEPPQTIGDGCQAHTGQLSFQLLGKLDFTVCGKLFSQRNKIGVQPLRTDATIAVIDDVQGTIEVGSVRPRPLLPPRAALQ